MELHQQYIQNLLRHNLLGPNAPRADSPAALAIIAGQATISVREGMTARRFGQIRALVTARASALMIFNGFIEEDDSIPTQGNNMVMITGVWL